MSGFEKDIARIEDITKSITAIEQSFLSDKKAFAKRGASELLKALEELPPLLQSLNDRLQKLENSEGNATLRRLAP